MCDGDMLLLFISSGSGTERKQRNLRDISVQVGTGCIGTGAILEPVLGTQPCQVKPDIGDVKKISLCHAHTSNKAAAAVALTHTYLTT